MGFDVFTRSRDENAPRWRQCYELASQLLEEQDYLRPLFEAPRQRVNHLEVRRFSHDDIRLRIATQGLEASLKGYVPTNKYDGKAVEPPFPREIMDGAAFSLKRVIDYAMARKVKLFIDG